MTVVRTTPSQSSSAERADLGDAWIVSIMIQNSSINTMNVFFMIGDNSYNQKNQIHNL
eukprot:m.346143 g.346143  ORF g.346143 m.346143 type:complete len:58 (+) comp28204_c0_seq1:1142-1315(+)